MSADLTLAIEPKATQTNKKSLQTPYGVGDVARIAVWIGLLCGFGDLGIMVVRRRWTSPDFYRVGENFPWVIPLADQLLLLLPSFLIGIVALGRGSVRPGITVFLITFAGLLCMFARFPLELWACGIVAAGIATQCARRAARDPARFANLVRKTVWFLVLTLAVTMVITIAGRAWSDARQRAALPPPPQGAANVLLVVWDTVRAASTSLHGYSRRTTPNLEKLATRGVSFDRAFATSSWTLPSHAGILTGRWPHEVGVNWKSPMRDDVPTLAENLAARGYDTAGFVGNLDYCSRETGLARGFGNYEDFPLTIFDAFIRYTALGRRVDQLSWRFKIDSLLERWGAGRRWHEWIPGSREHVKNAEAIDRSFLAWLDRRHEKTRPFFAFLNLNDAHSPYEVPDKSIPGFGTRPQNPGDREVLQQFTGIDKMQLSAEHGNMLIDVYDDSIFYLDRQLGLLLDDLSQRRLLENTVVIVTSDHGEHLGDHRLFFHGNSLYRQSVQVPLVIAGTAMRVPAGRTVAETIGLNDLPATVIDLLGLPGRAPFLGHSLRRYWEPRPARESLVPDPLLMETTKPVFLTNDGREPAAKGPMKGVIAGGMHYIRMADGTEELFKISDIEEKENLVLDPQTEPVLFQFRNLLQLLLQKR